MPSTMPLCASTGQCYTTILGPKMFIFHLYYFSQQQQQKSVRFVYKSTTGNHAIMCHYPSSRTHRHKHEYSTGSNPLERKKLNSLDSTVINHLERKKVNDLDGRLNALKVSNTG